MTTHLCWRPEFGHTRADATQVDAPDCETAAELYVKGKFADWDWVTDATVHVLPPGVEQTEEVFDVVVESIPVFHAFKKKPT